MSTLLKFVAKELGLSKGKIKDMIRDKKIEAELVDGHYYVDIDEIKEVLKNPFSKKSIIDDEKFVSHLNHLSYQFYKIYLQTSDDYFKRKYDLVNDVLDGKEDFFTLSQLKDLAVVQFDLNKKRLKRGLMDDETYKQIEIFGDIVEGFKKHHTDINVINSQYPHLYFNKIA